MERLWKCNQWNGPCTDIMYSLKIVVMYCDDLIYHLTKILVLVQIYIYVIICLDILHNSNMCVLF